MRLTFVLFLFLTIASTANNCYAQRSKRPHTPLTERIDSSKIEVRPIDSAALNQYSKQKDFTYDDVAPASVSLWQRFWNWFWDVVGRVVGNKFSGSLIKYLLIGLVIAIVVFIVIKLLGLNFSILTGKSATVEVPFVTAIENIHEINFDEQLEQALQSSNYRLAVRLLYLKTLKRLSDQGIIAWLPDKTNRHYVDEIRNEQQKRAFANLTLQFEYIWYGDFAIDSSRFESVNQSFQSFNTTGK